jgi:hypothetical protein
MQSGYKESVEAVRRGVKFRDANLPGYELGSVGIELNRIGSGRIMARKESVCEKKTSVI